MNTIPDFESPNLYDNLGIPEDSSYSDIKDSYRTLAKKYHPDKNKEDPKATEKFRIITRAYSTLSNKTDKEMYDETLKRSRFNSKSGNPFNMDFLDQEFWNSMFYGTGYTEPNQKGADVTVIQRLELQDFKKGKDLIIRLSTGKIQIKVPKDTLPGVTLRVQGKGEDLGYGDPGDLLVKLVAIDSRDFKLHESGDVSTEVTVSLNDVLLGKSIEVRTLVSTVKIQLSECHDINKSLRLPGMGISDKNFIVNIKLKLPKNLTSEIKSLLNSYKFKSFD